MNIAIFLSMISLIPLLFSINFLYSSNTYAFSNQNYYNDIGLAATNSTFTESEPRIQSSVEDDEETSITSNNETLQEAQTLQNQTSYIENIIKPKFENKSSTPPVSIESQYANLRNNYLSEWERLPFQSAFDTFINENSTQGYGIFTERNSSIFNSSQIISLYIEPTGFKHEPTIDKKGNKLYLTNITAIITMEDDKGNEVPSIEDIQNYTFKSHNKITELSLPIDLDLTSYVLSGDYIITFSLIDNLSKENFNIQKILLSNRI